MALQQWKQLWKRIRAQQSGLFSEASHRSLQSQHRKISWFPKLVSSFICLWNFPDRVFISWYYWWAQEMESTDDLRKNIYCALQTWPGRGTPVIIDIWDGVAEVGLQLKITESHSPSFWFGFLLFLCLSLCFVSIWESPCLLAAVSLPLALCTCVHCPFVFYLLAGFSSRLFMHGYM